MSTIFSRNDSQILRAHWDNAMRHSDGNVHKFNRDFVATRRTLESLNEIFDRNFGEMFRSAVHGESSINKILSDPLSKI